MQCSIFCLPDDVTERDVMLWFKKYCPSDVIMTKMGNDLRVAVVSLPKIHAEAALKELKGFNAKGHPLKPESTEPKSTTAEPGTTGEESASALSGSASDTHGMVISKSPRAGATFVPQHFGTMGSFDTLMSQLRKLHPSIKRETIVEALIELRAQHRGHLIGLPLRKIRELASELLTRSETDANA
ncbi:RNA-binding protein 44 [Cynoglossus semilaevis]|uniref:RNA-binding protein 44 n=1 Tax=Cynoglossus semilaevis TaxID=244447 RepID=UPI000D62BB3C|nr:RNA-binding protein 44 [Cynoglossus semilaevis]